MGNRGITDNTIFQENEIQVGGESHETEERNKKAGSKGKKGKKGNKTKRALKKLLIALGVIAVLVIAGKMILFPHYDDISTTGKYAFSSMDYWVTEDRVDPFLNDGSLREVQVRAWYPMDYDAEEKLPVVIASHGSCGTIDNNEMLYMELASHGYVVLAVAHPGHAIETVHSNGKKQSVDMDYLQATGKMKPQERPEEAAEIFAEWMDLRMTDLSCVMDDFTERVIIARSTIERPENFAFPSADITRFVSLGHSAGGSTALGMARIRDDIVAVISLEAPCMYDIKGVENGEFIFDESDYNVPVLHIYSDSSYSHLREWMQYKNNANALDRGTVTDITSAPAVEISDTTSATEVSNTTAATDGSTDSLDAPNDNSVAPASASPSTPHYESIYYKGTGHMGLCDLSLASPILSRLLDQSKSTANPEFILKRLNEDCLDFLSRNVK